MNKQLPENVHLGRVLSQSILRSLGIAVVTIENKHTSEDGGPSPEKTITGYYHFDSFCWPKAGPSIVEFGTKVPMNDPLRVDQFVFYRVESSAERTARIASYDTRAGLDNASEGDLAMEKKGHPLIKNLCLQWQWEQKEEEISRRIKFRVYENGEDDIDNPLFEGTMNQLKALGDTRLWTHKKLVIRELYRERWVICDGDPREAFRQGDPILRDPVNHGPSKPRHKKRQKGGGNRDNGSSSGSAHDTNDTSDDHVAREETVTAA